MSEVQLPLWFFPLPDGGYAAMCHHHAAWRWRGDSLSEENVEAAKKSLKRHHSRHTSIGVQFHDCLPGERV